MKLEHDTICTAVLNFIDSMRASAEKMQNDYKNTTLEHYYTGKIEAFDAVSEYVYAYSKAIERIIDNDRP